MMVLALLVLAAQADVAAWDGLPIPSAATAPTVRYITCISAPVEGVLTTGQPAEPAAREALMAKALADCRPVRAATVAELDTGMARTPGWTDPAIRHARVERMLAAAEERVGFSTVTREDFLNLAEAMRQCVHAGHKDCDKRVPPPAMPQ